MTNKYYLHHLLLLCFIAAFCLQSASAQPYQTNPDYKRTFVWYFGKHTGLDFKTNPPTVLSDGAIDTWEGCSAISDTAGNLLLYTDGVTVWNKFHKPLKNGTGLLGDISSSQSGLILHHPDNDSIYYIITTPHRLSHNNGMNYSAVNIKGNSDSGEVVEKNTLLHFSSAEKVTATNHSNGRDIWVVGHEFGNNIFYAYLLTANGFQKCPVISQTGKIFNNTLDNPGTFVFSPDGSWLASCLYISSQVDLLLFDKEQGHISIHKSINNMQLVGGGAFSKENNYLYINEAYKSTLQINIRTGNIVTIHPSLIGKDRWTTCPQLTPYGNILTGYADSAFLNSINFPEKDSIQCNYEVKYLSWNYPSTNMHSLPNFNQSYFHTPAIDFAYSSDCITNTINFEGRDTFMASAHLWQFKRKYASGLNVAATKSPLHTFTDTGVYEVMYIASNGSRSDTALKNITIYPKINKQFLGADTGYCQGSIPSILLAAPAGMHCYLWSNGSTSQNITIDTAGIYWVKITTPFFCTLWDTIQVTELQPVPKPFIWLSNDTLYSSVTGNYQFRWLKNGQLASTSKNFFKTSQSGNYTLALSNGNGCDSLSNAVDVSLSLFIPSNINVLVYPNPASESIQIQGLSPTDTPAWNLFTIQGKFVDSGNTTLIPTKSFAQGLYLLNILHQNKSFYFKIIINHP